MAHATLASESTIDALLEMSTSPHRMRGLEARAKPGWGVLAEEAPKPAAQQTSHGSATSSGSRSPSTESPNLFEDNEPPLAEATVPSVPVAVVMVEQWRQAEDAGTPADEEEEVEEVNEAAAALRGGLAAAEAMVAAASPRAPASKPARRRKRGRAKPTAADAPLQPHDDDGEGDDGKPGRKLSCPWSADEDAMLTRAVEEVGARRWTAIAQLVPGRTGKQCRLRWCNQINPDIRHDAFTEQECRARPTTPRRALRHTPLCPPPDARSPTTTASGGRSHPARPRRPRCPLDGDRQAAARPHGQRDQEPLERHAVEGGAGGGPGAGPAHRPQRPLPRRIARDRPVARVQLNEPAVARRRCPAPPPARAGCPAHMTFKPVRRAPSSLGAHSK